MRLWSISWSKGFTNKEMLHLLVADDYDFIIVNLCLYSHKIATLFSYTYDFILLFSMPLLIFPQWSSDAPSYFLCFLVITRQIKSVSADLDNVLLAGLVLGRPLHRAAAQIHGELGFGLTSSELHGDKRRIRGGRLNTTWSHRDKHWLRSLLSDCCLLFYSENWHRLTYMNIYDRRTDLKTCVCCI